MKSILAVALQIVTLAAGAVQRHRAVALPSPIGSVIEYTVPGATSITGLTRGPDGAVWFTAATDFGGEMGRVGSGGDIAVAAKYSGKAGALATGPDGALWIAFPGQIGRFVPDGVLTFFDVRPQAGIIDMTFAGDGALWFVEAGKDRIGRLTLTGDLTEFPLPPSLAFTSGMAAGPDGAIWFVTPYLIGRLSPDGAITTYDPFKALNRWPTMISDIAPGPDGNSLFVTLTGDPGVGVGDGIDGLVVRVSIQGDVSTVVPIPDPLYPNVLIRGDDAYYTSDCVCARLLRIRSIVSRIVDGVVTKRYDMPVEINGLKYVSSMAQSADGNIWAAYGGQFPIIVKLVLH
jgi:streptogramin lyase